MSVDGPLRERGKASGVPGRARKGHDRPADDNINQQPEADGEEAK